MAVLIKRDGTLVVREHGEEDEFLDPSDPFAIVYPFRAAVELEEGITPFQMMRALSPWSDAISAAGWFDFDGWLRAMTRPLVAEAREEPDRLAGIEIHPVIHVQRRKASGERMAEVFVAWQSRGRYANPVVGRDGRVDAYCSLSFLNPGLLGHLPVTIVREASVNDIHVHAPWREAPILSPASPGVYGRLECTPSLFDAVILGFLNDISFHGTPEATQVVAEDLREAVRRIDEGEAVPVARTPAGTSVLEELGILDDDDRAAIRKNAEAVGLAGLIEACDGPPAALAEAMGLTEFGLAALARGEVACFTAETLERFSATARAFAEKGGR